MRTVLQRFVAPVTAQGLFSLGQMAVTLIGALALDADTWGRLAVLLTVFFLANSFVRGFGAQPLVTFLAGADLRAARRAAITMSLIAAAPVLVALPVVGWAIGLPFTGLALAVAFGAYSSYDVARSVELADGSHRRLTAADGVLLGLVASGSGLTFVTGFDATTTIPVAMLVGYATALVVLTSGRSSTTPWTLRAHRARFGRDMVFLAADGLLLSAAIGAVVFALAAFASPAAAGDLRTALTLVAGPLQMVHTALSPLIVRSIRERSDRPVRIAARFTASVAAVGAVTGVTWGGLAAAGFAAVGDGSGVGSSAVYAFVAPVLATALWVCSVLAMHQRYRRRALELSAVRAASTGCAAVAVAVALLASVDPGPAVLIAAAAALGPALGHVVVARTSRPSPVGVR